MGLKFWALSGPSRACFFGAGRGLEILDLTTIVLFQTLKNCLGHPLGTFSICLNSTH